MDKIIYMVIGMGFDKDSKMGTLLNINKDSIAAKILFNLLY